MRSHTQNNKLTKTYLKNKPPLITQHNLKNEQNTINANSNRTYKEYSINSSFKEFKDHNHEISSYLNELKYLNQKTTQVSNLTTITKGLDFSLMIYKLVEGLIDQPGLSSIDFSSLSDRIEVPIEEIIVFQCDINRPGELTNQTEYELYTIEGLLLNTSSLSQNKIVITSTIENIEDPSIRNVKYLSQQGINAFNKAHPFYNDSCFKFQNENHTDVSIEDRRKHYYPQTELCESNCTFISINSNNNIKCFCPYKTSFSNIVVSNPSTSQFQNEEFQSYKAIDCPSQLLFKEELLNYPFVFVLSMLVIIALIFLYFLKNSAFLVNKYIRDCLPSSSSNILQSKANSKLLPIILPCPPKSNKDSGYHTPNKSVDTHIEEESFGEIKINNFQDKEGSPLRQNFLKKGGGNGDNLNEKTPDEQSENALIEKLKKSLMNQTEGNENENLHRYFFTRNSENESNPNYSKKMSTEMNQNDLKSGRSLTHFNNYDNKRTRDMLRYNDNDEESEKRGLANFNSKIYTKGLALRDDISQDSQSKNDGKPFSVQHEISVSIQNRDKEDDDLIYSSFKNKVHAIKQKKSSKAEVEAVVQNKTKKEEAANTKVSFCRTYFNYAKRREIFLITFFAKKAYLPFFIKFPIFLFCLTIIFTVHSLLFTNFFLTGRFDAENLAIFWFEEELVRCLYTAVLANVIKIIIVKLLIFYVFRIEKKILSRENFRVILNRLRCRSATVFIVLLILMFGLFYINTCYCGIFKKTQYDFFIGYVVTLLFSFIFAMVLCLLINVIGLIGVKCNFT